MDTTDFDGTKADRAVGSVVALQGATTAEIQRLLGDFAKRRVRDGFRVGGVVETWDALAKDKRHAHALLDLLSGEVFAIYQDLGSESHSCSLDGTELASACAAVQAAIHNGADLIVLSKFGKIEAEGGGLVDCFRAAAEAGIPIATGVSPAVTPLFLDFAGGFAHCVQACDEALESWWLSQRRVAGSDPEGVQPSV
jgi:hypothetical protein